MGLQEFREKFGTAFAEFIGTFVREALLCFAISVKLAWFPPALLVLSAFNSPCSTSRMLCSCNEDFGLGYPACRWVRHRLCSYCNRARPCVYRVRRWTDQRRACQPGGGTCGYSHLAHLWRTASLAKVRARLS